MTNTRTNSWFRKLEEYPVGTRLAARFVPENEDVEIIKVRRDLYNFRTSRRAYEIYYDRLAELIYLGGMTRVQKTGVAWLPPNISTTLKPILKEQEKN